MLTFAQWVPICHGPQFPSVCPLATGRRDLLSREHVELGSTCVASQGLAVSQWNYYIMRIRKLGNQDLSELPRFSSLLCTFLHPASVNTGFLIH